MILIISLLTVFCRTPTTVCQNYVFYNFEFGEGSGWSRDCFGGHEWTLDLTQGHVSNGSMKSTDLGSETRTLGLGISDLCRNVTGPAYISFWWKSETTPSGYGDLGFFVDNDQKPLFSNSSWSNKIYYFPDKRIYKIEWRYTQIKAGLAKGTGWVDDVDITPSSLSNITTNIICSIAAPDLVCVGSTNTASASHQNNVSYSWQIIGGEILGNPNNESIEWKAGKCQNASIILRASKQDSYFATYTKNVVVIPNTVAHGNMTVLELYKLSPMCKNNTTYVDAKNFNPLKHIYSNITDAINNVTCGGTVKIAKGVYDEQIIINKPLNLIGIDKNNTIITGLGNAIYVSSNNVRIENITIKGGLEGIFVICANYCNLNNINIYDCTFDGIYFLMSNNSKIQKCDMRNISKSSGIYMYSSHNCNIKSNIIYNTKYGIQLINSSNNTIDNNIFNSLSTGILFLEKSNVNNISCTNEFHSTFCNISIDDQLKNEICEKKYKSCREIQL